MTRFLLQGGQPAPPGPGSARHGAEYPCIRLLFSSPRPVLPGCHIPRRKNLLCFLSRRSQTCPAPRRGGPMPGKDFRRRCRTCLFPSPGPGPLPQSFRSVPRRRSPSRRGQGSPRLCRRHRPRPQGRSGPECLFHPCGRLPPAGLRRPQGFRTAARRHPAGHRFRPEPLSSWGPRPPVQPPARKGRPE